MRYSCSPRLDQCVGRRLSGSEPQQSRLKHDRANGQPAGGVRPPAVRSLRFRSGPPDALRRRAAQRSRVLRARSVHVPAAGWWRTRAGWFGSHSAHCPARSRYLRQVRRASTMLPCTSTILSLEPTRSTSKRPRSPIRSHSRDLLRPAAWCPDPDSAGGLRLSDVSAEPKLDERYGSRRPLLSGYTFGWPLRFTRLMLSITKLWVGTCTNRARLALPPARAAASPSVDYRPPPAKLGVGPVRAIGGALKGKEQQACWRPRQQQHDLCWDYDRPGGRARAPAHFQSRCQQHHRFTD